MTTTELWHSGSLSQQIRALRESKGMSRRHFARALCEIAGDPDYITEGALEQWESGRTDPRGKYVFALYELAGKPIPPLYTPTGGGRN
jgi:transcriptional regulator with XRE-family HTH domain